MANNIVELIIKGSDQSSKALASSVQNLKGMESAVGSIGRSLAGLVSAGALISLGRDALQLGDDLSKASKKFGMSVENLSALKYAAEIADVPFDSLQVGLGKLSQAMVKGAEKGSDMSYAFHAMGIDIKSFNGDVGAALVAISQKFQTFEKGAGAVDLAKAILGRAGANMLPAMEDIAKGFGHMKEKASEFHALMSSEEAKKMEQYNENLKSIKLTTTQAAVGVINFAGDVSGWIQRATENALKLEKALSDIAEKAVLGGTKPKGDTSGEIRYKAPPLPALKPAPDADLQKFKDKAEKIRKSTSMFIDPAHFAEMVKASERDIDKLKTMAEGYAKEKVKLISEEGKVAHDALREEMGLTADYYSTAEKAATEYYSATEKETNDYLDLQRELSKEIDDATRDETAPGGFIPEMTVEEVMAVATAYGNVSLAIQTMNSDLGAQFALVAEGQSYVSLYKQAWLDANLAIADSITSLYSGMQNWISSSIQGLVEGTMTIQNVMANLGKMMLQIVSDYIAKWIMSKETMAALEAAFAVKSIVVQEATTTAHVAGAIVEAEASTAAGSARALGDFPWPYSLIVAGIVAAAGAVIIGGIAGAAHGGLDYVPAESTFMLQRGERVVSPKQNEDLTDFLGGRGGQDLTVNLYMDGEAICNVVKKGVRRGRLNLVLA